MTSPNAVTGAGRERIRVLLVDDNETFLGLTKKLVEGPEGIVVAGTGRNTADALAQAEALKPAVIVLDLSMGQSWGGDAIPRLRELHPRMGIVVLTLLETELYRQESLGAGADEFVAKSKMARDLVPAILRSAGARGSGKG